MPACICTVQSTRAALYLGGINTCTCGAHRLTKKKHKKALLPVGKQNAKRIMHCAWFTSLVCPCLILTVFYFICLKGAKKLNKVHTWSGVSCARVEFPKITLKRLKDSACPEATLRPVVLWDDPHFDFYSQPHQQRLPSSFSSLFIFDCTTSGHKTFLMMVQKKRTFVKYLIQWLQWFVIFRNADLSPFIMISRH